MTENKLTTKQYWDDGYKNYVFSEMPYDYPIVKKLYKHFSKSNGRSVFEIGCFPGRFLYHFGKLGYYLNGLDQTEYLPEMIDWFKKNNFKLGFFQKEDLFKIKNDSKYDIVFSSGFIEHFSKFEEAIQIHAGLVKEDGYIFITTPNFSGFMQNKLHLWLDKNNLDKHNIKSMNPEIWKNLLVKNGFDIIEYGYIGGFDFWTGNEKRRVFKKVIIKILRLISKIKIFPNSKHYSPEIILIAKKH
jgi:SAM-dependent methyltransferase